MPTIFTDCDLIPCLRIDILDRTPTSSVSSDATSVVGSDATTASATSIGDEAELQYKVDAEMQDRAYLAREGYPLCYPPVYTLPYDPGLGVVMQFPAALYYVEGESPRSEDMPVTAKAGD